MIKRGVFVICVLSVLFPPMDSLAAEDLSGKVTAAALYGAAIGAAAGFVNGFARAAVPGESYNPRRQAGDMLGGLVIGAAIGAAYGLITGRRGSEAPAETADYVRRLEVSRFDSKGFSVPPGLKMIETKTYSFHYPY